MTRCLLLSFFNLPDAIYYVRPWRRGAILGLVYLSVSLGPQSYLLLPCHFLKSFIPSSTQFCKTAIEILHNGCAPFKGTGSIVHEFHVSVWRMWQFARPSSPARSDIRSVAQSACQPLGTETFFPDKENETWKWLLTSIHCREETGVHRRHSN